MTLTQVKSLPENKRYHYNDLQEIIEKFMNSDATIARVDYSKDEYDNSSALYSCMYNAVRCSNKRVKVCMRNHEVYLIKL